VIEHDNQIGDFAHVAPGAVLAGDVVVGEAALIGAGAVVLPGDSYRRGRRGRGGSGGHPAGRRRRER
jgi:acetyltransferase-like isoleucine patch superfamily enzyme